LGPIALLEALLCLIVARGVGSEVAAGRER